MHEHIVEQTLAFLVPQIEEKIAEVFQVLIQEHIHEHIVDPSFPRSAVVKSGKKGKLGVAPVIWLVAEKTQRTPPPKERRLEFSHTASNYCSQRSGHSHPM